MSKAFPISRQGQIKNEHAAVLANAKSSKISKRQVAIDANETDKKYTLFHRNKAVMNWDTLDILRQWMFDLDMGGMGTFIHYNEDGILTYQGNKA